MGKYNSDIMQMFFDGCRYGTKPFDTRFILGEHPLPGAELSNKLLSDWIHKNPWFMDLGIPKIGKKIQVRFLPEMNHLDFLKLKLPFTTYWSPQACQVSENEIYVFNSKLNRWEVFQIRTRKRMRNSPIISFLRDYLESVKLSMT